MSTYSTLAVINKALVLCGATTVSSLTEDTPNARAVNSVYEIARKTFQTECKWNFSTTRSTLATASTSVIGWLYTDEAYAYLRPTDALRIWEMNDKYSIWREEGGYIISDTNSLGAKYTFDQSDLSTWFSTAIEAFIDKLCADISYIILNSATKAESFLGKYEKISLPKAMSQNSQTGTQQIPRDDSWERAKFSNGNPDA